MSVSGNVTRYVLSRESVCSANHIERINSGLLCVETGGGVDG